MKRAIERSMVCLAALMVIMLLTFVRQIFVSRHGSSLVALFGACFLLQVLLFIAHQRCDSLPDRQPRLSLWHRLHPIGSVIPHR